jgi:chemotaxis signal transduction protein
MLPVIDLAPRLGTRHGPDVGRVWRSRNRILRIEHRDRQLGVAVDLVGGIHQLQPDQRRKPVLGDGVADLCLGDLWLMDGVTVQEIRFDALLDGLEQGLLSPQDHRTLP